MRFCSIYLLLLLSCTAAQKAVAPNTTSKMDQFDKQGHRGCRGLMPENTIAAMKTALDLGVTTLELDVVITKDKQVVLSHEPWFGHQITTKPDGTHIRPSEEKSYNIYNMTYDEVKSFDVGIKPHPRFPRQQKIRAVKPLLSHLLDSVQQYMITSRRPHPFFNIETKTKPSGDNIFHPAPAEFVELLMAVIKEKGIEDRVIIQSFDFRTLQYLHQKYPHIKTAALIDAEDRRSLPEIWNSLGFMPTIYSPHHSLASKQVIEDCHRNNIRIIPWTVNSKKQIEKLTALGVDGIITDYPDLFQ
jgi:glycerophosphoryl diester phosphodiesterase